MSKEEITEALDWLEEKCYVESPQAEKFEECCKIIRQFLQRLEAIDNANPSEALKCLEDIYRNGVFISEVSFEKQHPTNISPETNKSIDIQCKTIKQALLKAQKEHKALDTIKKFIWVEDGKLKCGRYGDIEIELEEEDFESKDELDLLKEVLE